MTHDALVETDDALAELAADDRLAMLEPAPPLRRRLGRLLPVALVSLAVHAGLFILFVLVIKEPPPIPQEQETPVEIVQEKPSEPKPPEPKKTEPKQPEPKEEAKPAPKPEEKPVEAARPPDQPKQADVKPEPAKQEPPKPELPKPEPTKADQPKPAPVVKADPKPEPPAADKAAEDAKALQSLQDELAALKAEQAGLQAEKALHPEPGQALGLLPDSFASVAAPMASAEGDDPITYQQVVYNLIAKAKKSGRVFVPGMAHVVFNVGANGELLDVTLDHASGNPIVDEEAVAIVRRAAPFPPPPPGSPRSFPAYMSFVADQ